MNRMGKIMILIVKACWVGVCFLFLLNLFYQNTDLKDKEAIIEFVLSMRVVTFPIGHLVWAIFSYKSMAFPGAIISIQIDLFIRWIFFVVAGYFQWFYVLPTLNNWIKGASIKEKVKGIMRIVYGKPGPH